MATNDVDMLTHWRTTGCYLAQTASKAGLLAETRLFLLTYAQLHDLRATREALVNGGLPQRARATRVTIVTVIQRRLTRWSPPPWVYADLTRFAAEPDQPSLAAALLLHVVRQDALLYDFVQHVVLPRWEHGDQRLVRADVQRFLDLALPTHPEIDTWRQTTRTKVAGNVLSIFRDYGLMRGRAVKQIVEPLVPPNVVAHLIRLLRAEGVAEPDIAAHPDWQIWLWNQRRVQATLHAHTAREACA